MDKKKLMDNLEKRGFAVAYFDKGAEAAEYLCGQLEGETVGFGGSKTAEALGLYEKLGEKNNVIWHWKEPGARGRYAEFTAYISSANAVSETGELVNIDGTGNRVSATIFGPKKVYFLCGVNKVAPDLASAIDRARNVASVKNAQRFNVKTPCVTTGKCSDCSSPERICRVMSIHMCAPGGAERTEVILIGEDLGY
jgi:L-lactate utilization protein LutB